MDFIRRFSDKCPHVNNIFLKLSLKYAENVNHTCFETHNLGFFYLPSISIIILSDLNVFEDTASARRYVSVCP